MNDNTDKKETLSFRPWTAEQEPQRILIIRMQAIGDIAITFPSCTALRRMLPNSQIDFLTTSTSESLVSVLNIFDHVHIFPSSDNRWDRLRKTIVTSLSLRNHGYELVIDLQRNWVSRFMRRAISPRSWGEFDRFSAKSAGQRTLETSHRIGLEKLLPDYSLEIKSDYLEKAKSLLLEHGWDGITPLVVLNPAGLWETRNWQLENYIHLAKLWLKEEQVKFLFLGTERIFDKEKFIEKELSGFTINLVNKTTLGEALAVLQYASCMVSEDSGLMHMAWASGVPTIALFGSTNHIWSTPHGEHSKCFHSGDLPCGDCQQPTCRFGDVHCLTRYTPEFVYEQAQLLMRKNKKELMIS